MFQVKTITYEEREFQPDELITIAEAARMLGMTVQGVGSMINRGVLTEVLAPVKSRIYQNRRMIVRAEVEKMVGEK